MKNRWIVRGLEILLLITIIFFGVIVGLGEAVLQLWNWLMPSLFGLHQITFWQAVGVLCLSWILFGRAFLGGRACGRHWRNRMRDRREHMTPEQRAQFRQGMQQRCGGFGPSPAEPKP
jgi:Ca2+/H+ antiporter, TMEM165/GDT1 family